MYTNLEEDTVNNKTITKRKMPVLKNCCCFTIETGTWIIGVLDFLSSLFGLIVSSVLLPAYSSDEWKNLIKKTIEENQKETVQNIDDILAFIQVYLKHLFIACIVIYCVYIIITMLLFVGLHQRKAVLMLPYMTLEMTNGILIGILLLISFGALIFGDNLGVAFAFFIYLLGCFLLFVYMWIVVYSHYCVLKEENARGQYDKQVYRAS